VGSDVDYIHENINTGLVSGDVPDWEDKPKAKVKPHVYHHYSYDYRTGILQFKNFKKALAWAKENSGFSIVKSKTKAGEYESEPHWQGGKPSDKAMKAFIKKNAETFWYKDNPLVARGCGAYERYVASLPKPVSKPTRPILKLNK
jgi:hypothetical protein